MLLGLFFWLPFWSFFNICPAYVNDHFDTARFYNSIEHVFGSGFARILSKNDNGIWKINGEAIANTGWIILIFQVLISRIFETRKALPSFMFGLLVAFLGFALIGYSINLAPAMVIAGIFIFAVGEMITSPRIQEYITWIAPKEKAGLYMGSNFLATGLGGTLSGIIYTSLYGYFRNDLHQPEYIWFTLAGNILLGILVLFIFTKTLGEFKELEE